MNKVDLGKYLVTFRAIDSSGFESRITTAVRVARDGTKAFGPYVVIALSGFSRWSWLGPKPSLIKARESGTVLNCQP